MSHPVKRFLLVQRDNADEDINTFTYVSYATDEENFVNDRQEYSKSDQDVQLFPKFPLFPQKLKMLAKCGVLQELAAKEPVGLNPSAWRDLQM